MLSATYTLDPITPRLIAVECDGSGRLPEDKAAQMVRDLELFLSSELANPHDGRRISFRSRHPGFAVRPLNPVLLAKE